LRWFRSQEKTSCRKNLPEEGRTDVHKKIVSSFALLILLTFALSIMVIYQVKTYPIVDTPPGIAGQHASDFFSSGGNLRHGLQFRLVLQKSMLILSMCLIVSLFSFMWFLVRSVANPLQRMERYTRELANGDLDRLMPTYATSKDPIGKIGENVHELAINLQEILLLIWNLSEQDIELLDRNIALLQTAGVPGTGERVLSNLQVLKQHREDTQNMVREFELFNVMLQDKKVFAKHDTAALHEEMTGGKDVMVGREFTARDESGC